MRRVHFFEKSGRPRKCDVVVNPCCRETFAWKIGDPAEAIAEGGSAFLGIVRDSTD